jgi:hypothetical protein
MAESEEQSLTDTETLIACLRICGLHVGPDTHRMAPEICPVLLGYWMNPRLRAEARAREKRSKAAGA